jgi:hypothetical protein
MITKRGKRVRAVALLLALSFGLWGLWEVASHLLWTGTGWEWCEDLLNCEKEGK